MDNEVKVGDYCKFKYKTQEIINKGDSSYYSDYQWEYVSYMKCESNSDNDGKFHPIAYNKDNSIIHDLSSHNVRYNDVEIYYDYSIDSIEGHLDILGKRL